VKGADGSSPLQAFSPTPLEYKSFLRTDTRWWFSCTEGPEDSDRFGWERSI